MKKYTIVICLILGALSINSNVNAQTKPDKELRLNLNDEGTHYIKTTLTAQLWGRYTDMNPGSTIGGFNNPSSFDIGIRRMRQQIFGMVTDKVFFYSQLGINNFNNIADRKPGIFFHDVLAEYYVTPKALQVGMGLTAWTGFTRFASPAVASIMGFDAPLFEQNTNDANDQFLRKLSIYAKGKIGKLDYRFIVSDPLLASKAAGSVVKTIGVNSDFSYKPPHMQTSAYVMYQFLEEESNLTPYMTGTYLGKKRVFNVGAGFQYQANAMWRYGDAVLKDTIQEDMLNYAIDAYYDAPMGTKGMAISAYVTAMYLGYGKNYIRNLGVMNPADGVAAGTPTINGAGNAFPMMGTGTIIAGQVGVLLPQNVLGEKNGQLQPYIMVLHGNFDRLQQSMLQYDAGLNWYINGYRSKLTLNYQNRPVFSNTDLKESDRKSMVVLQFQIAI
ncbi:MAG: hypothetical protein V4620_12350 [Bacteroidota bacterium]